MLTKSLFVMRLDLMQLNNTVLCINFQRCSEETIFFLLKPAFGYIYLFFLYVFTLNLANSGNVCNFHRQRSYSPLLNGHRDSQTDTAKPPTAKDSQPSCKECYNAQKEYLYFY